MLDGLWREIKRRNVPKAAISYLAVAWLVLQACSILFPIFSIDSHVQRLLVIGMSILFPFWLTFAWIYEYTKEGFVKTEELAIDSEVFGQTNKRLNTIIIAVLSGAVILLVSDRVFKFSSFNSDNQIKNSIAVLPFANLSGDDQQTYYAAGMQDELIGHLAKLGNLRVISRTSTQKYSGTQLSMKEIAQELGVNLLVEGSLMKYEDSVRIQIQLINASEKEDHLWNRYYDRPIKSVLDMHSEVTLDIVESIELALSPQEKQNLASVTEVDPRAYDALLRGQFHLFQFTPQDIQMALQYFQQALTIDPYYADAYAIISGTGGFLLVMGALPPPIAGEMMLKNARKSLEINPQHAGGHFSMASAQTWSVWNWQKAETHFKRALELDPNSAVIHIYYSHFLGCMGRFEEALSHGNKALDLDPFNAFFHGLFAVSLMLTGDYMAAEKQGQKALQMDPLNPFPLSPLAVIYRKLGNADKSFQSIKNNNLAMGDTLMVRVMGDAYETGGYKAGFMAAAEVLKSRRKSTNIQPHRLVHLYDSAGEIEQALDWLDSSYVYRGPSMVYSGSMPYSDAMRLHPRFKKIVDRMNFPFDYLAPR